VIVLECEVCGANTHDLVDADFGGSVLLSCPRCRAGKKVFEKKEPSESFAGKKIAFAQKELSEFSPVLGFGAKIRNAREGMGLTHKELAEKLFEKETTIRKVEGEKFPLSRALAQKLENFFSIELSLQPENNESDLSTEETGCFTLGDFVKKKKQI
jgi:uncharacterized protein (TIGR00270 family)